MNCVKTLTNGRISLTKHLTPYEQTLLTTHTQRTLSTLSTNQLISMLSAAVLPFQSTETPDSVCFREPISMTKARKHLILCFRLSFYRPKARKCPITCFRLIKDAKFNYRPLHSRLNPIYLPQICADIEYVHKLCRPVWPGYLKPLSNESAPINCH